jgi:site-specific DNA recombinase
MGELAGLYERISEDREGRELGVARQHEDLVNAVTNAGDMIVDTYRDNDISASTRSRKRRPAFERLISDAKSGRIKRIWAYTSNRLTRRPRESEDLIELAEKHGVEIRYLRSPSFDLNTSHGRQIARIMAANDAAESETISERVERRQLQIAQAGGFLGGRRPFGFEPDGVRHREVEARHIKDFAARLLAGDSLAAMARELNAAGITTSAGNPWRGETVGLMLRRERNAGLLRYQGQVLREAAWEPVIDVDTWRAVVAVLANPDRSQYRGSYVRKHLGANLYLCGVCDDGTTVRSGALKSSTAGGNPRSYRCRKYSHLSRSAAPVDDMVERHAVARLMEPDAVELLAPPSKGGEMRRLHEEANTLRSRLDELDDELDDGVIDKARWRRRTERLSGRLAEIDKALSATTFSAVLDGLAGNADLPKLWYGTLPDRSDGLPLHRRRAVIDALMTVTLEPGGHRRPPGWRAGHSYFDPQSVRIEWRTN